MDFNKIYKSHSINKAGFTLIEVAIVIFVSAALLLALMQIYLWHNTTFQFEQARTRVDESGRRLLGSFQENIPQAYRVVSSASVQGVNRSSDASTLVLQLPATDRNGNVVTGKWDYIAIYLSNGKIYEATQPDVASSRLATTRLLADSVSSLTFTYNDADFTKVAYVGVSAEISVPTIKQQVRGTFNQNFYLLNF